MRDAKLSVVAVYEVLKKYSAYDHTLTQKQVQELVKSEYGLEVSRNTVKDTLERLRRFYGEEVICCETSARGKANGETEDYTYAYYMDRDAAENVFSDEEIAKLLDVCMYARNLSAKEAKELVRKLKKMATAEFYKEVDYTDDIPEKQFNINARTSDHLRTLRRVISKNRRRVQQWVCFSFNYYSSNQEKQLTFYREYTVLPLAVCEANHRYYLLCAMEGSSEKIYHYRIDLMTRVRTVEHERIEALEDLKKSLKTKDISEYMSQHLYMFYGEARQMDLEIPKDDEENEDANLTFLADAFGTEAGWRIKKETESSVIVSIRCVPRAMKVLLMQYAGKGIRVIGPEDVKREIEDGIREDCKKLMEFF